MASVPHTGTRFVHKLLAPRRRGGEQPDDGSFFFQHVDKENIPTLRRMMQSFPCIVPLRDPTATAISWRSRRMNVANLADDFRRLVSAIDPLGPYYLPLDVPNRQEYLDLINRELCQNLTTKWTPVCPSGEVARLGKNEREIVESMIDELGDFFSRFGYGGAG